MSDLALSIVLGIALAAATGFRVFLPMLVVGGAAYSGHLHLNDSFAWLGTPYALTMLSVAALAEVLAYYIPVIDNLLDSLATPAAFIAGTIVSAAVMTDVPPMVKWTAAVIAGGGVAGLTQGLTGILRTHSTVLTGGLGNSIIAAVELGGAVWHPFWRWWRRRLNRTAHVVPVSGGTSGPPVVSRSKIAGQPDVLMRAAFPRFGRASAPRSGQSEMRRTLLEDWRAPGWPSDKGRPGLAADRTRTRHADKELP